MHQKWARALPILPLIVIAGGLELCSRIGLIPSFLFPSPSSVIHAILDDFQAFQRAFYETTISAALGLMISIVSGLMIALFLNYSEILRKMFYPYTVFFQTVPLIAIAPLLVIWFGYGLPTVIVSAFIVSVFPVIANSVQGLMNTDTSLVSYFQLLGASRIKTLFHLRLPFALPTIFAGIRIAAGLSVIGAIVGEFISGSGLGGLVDASRNEQRIDRVFAAILLAALLGVLFFSLISVMSRLFLRHEENRSIF